MNLSKSQFSRETKEDLQNKRNEKLIDSGLPDLDIYDGFGSKVDDVLNGEFYNIDEIKDNISIKNKSTLVDNGVYKTNSYIYKNIPIGEVTYSLTDDILYIEKLMTSNSQKDNALREEDTRKNIWGRKLNIKGLGTFILEEIFNEAVEKGIKRIIFVYTEESENFYKKILPKFAEKFNANYSMISKTCVIEF